MDRALSDGILLRSRDWILPLTAADSRLRRRYEEAGDRVMRLLKMRTSDEKTLIMLIAAADGCHVLGCKSCAKHLRLWHMPCWQRCRAHPSSRHLLDAGLGTDIAVHPSDDGILTARAISL